jgi:energy-coupling factor transporter ATP-binding protein EcfA2
MLEASNISFSYDGKQKVLDSVNFQLKPGEIIAITGPTGSGKSTLAKCLSGFIPRIIEGDFSGTLSIDTEDTSDLSVPEIARKIGLVQQDPESQICTLKVSDEVAFGPENFLTEPNKIQSLVVSSLNAVESQYLYDRATYALSGGEKQRVAIASILAIQPRYIILDEPSSSLDPRGVVALQQILLELKRSNIGIICIEHKLSTVLPIANRVKYLSNGKINDWSPEITRKTSTSSLQSPSIDSNPTLISAKNVSFSYGENYAVKKVTVDVCEGEIVALMGDNGSGKTTLINIMGGLLKPGEGEIYVEGIPLRNLNRKEIASKIAIVFQNPNHQIFERTVWKEQILTLDILEMANEIAIEQSETTLSDIGLWDFKEQNPFSLSHGQKRRLNISSVTAHNPDILLFDEPFVGQDRSGHIFINEIIQNKVQAGGASIVITHAPSFALNYCTRTIFMDKGSVLLDGTPQAVLSRLEKMGRHEYAQLREVP